MSNVIYFKGNYNDLKHEISISGKFAVVIFHLSWCPVCKKLLSMIGPITEEHQDIRFIEVEAEENKEARGYFEITALPHTMFLRMKEDDTLGELDVFIGAKTSKLKEKILALKEKYQ